MSCLPPFPVWALTCQLQGREAARSCSADEDVEGRQGDGLGEGSQGWSSREGSPRARRERQGGAAPKPSSADLKQE